MKRTLVPVFVWGVLCLFIQVQAIAVLRDLAEKDDLFIGTAANYFTITSGEKNYTTILGQQYNLVTPENAMKWGATEPSRNQFTYTQGDGVLNYAKSHQQTVRGHNLCWGESNPSWLTGGKFSASELSQILQTHITNVVTHYRGQLYCWDVVNEAVSDSPTQNNPLKNNVWYPALPNYIELAFQWAHAADPNVKLFYNDYGGEGLTTKANAVYDLVKKLVDAKVPINGVGLQMHVGLKYSPSPADVDANIKRLGALGLEVHITEMDVSIDGGSGTTAQKLDAQATLYANMLKVCRQNKNCKSFETWGFTDKHTWLDQTSLPLPFSSNYEPKPAFNALAAGLQ